MKIYVDADACPVPIREILLRAAQRTATPLVLVANHALPVRQSRHVSLLRVAPGYDIADDEILARLEAGDLVITADIPLAAEVIEHRGQALSPRGELFTRDNVRPRLAMRDLMESLRASGIDSGGQAPLGQAERKAFADQLDRLLTRHG